MKCALLVLALTFLVRVGFAQDAPAAAALEPFVKSHSLAGAVAVVASKEKVLDVETVGFADIAAGKPMAADALFWIASMSKPITVTALMMLVDEGKVKLDEPVATYLPEFKDEWVIAETAPDHHLLRRPDHPITVRNILSHTSGLNFRAVVEQPTLDVLPLRNRVLAYASEPLLYQPETSYKYSNEGINTGGRIIEVVSGQKYEEFLQQRLFIPLGMKDTTFIPNAEQVARLAKSYKPTADKTNLEETPIGQLSYPLSDPQRQPMPAGGLFSTASDVAVFCQMILSGGEWKGRRYLSENAVAEMSRRQTPAALKESYGLGWQVNGTASFGHGGAYATNMTIHREKGLVTVFMVQHAGFANNGKDAQGAFVKAALETYGK
jgi:CubicO group peptidase (beta-lactamase class C family)